MPLKKAAKRYARAVAANALTQMARGTVNYAGSLAKRGYNRAYRWMYPPRVPRGKLPLLGFPKSQMVRLKYTETINLDASAGGLASHVFCANGMYDPNITGTGHQPLYFDQYMVAYDHYTVLSSKIKVTPVNPTTASIIPGAYGVVLDDNNVISYTTADQIIESNQGRSFKLFGPNNVPQTSYSKSITKKFSARKFFHKKAIVGSSDYKGSVSSNPADKANFIVWTGSIGGTNAGNVYLLVVIVTGKPYVH